MSVHHLPSHVGKAAAEHPGLVKFGRIGWLAKGVVYLIAGALAIGIVLSATGWSDSSSEEEASPTGALQAVADATAGSVLLWALAIGLLLYAAWRIAAAFMPGGKDAEAWAHRIGYVVGAIVYGSLAFTAISIARGGGDSGGSGTNSNAKVSDASADLMSHTGGRWLVGIAGLVVLAVGVYRIKKGVTGDVADELDLAGMSPTRQQWSRRLGAVGETGRGIALALVGVFVLRAAIAYDPEEATGLDGALRRVADEWWGAIVVLVVGLGFLAYGLFCATTFTHRRLESP